jgi:hypothetical protein
MAGNDRHAAKRDHRPPHQGVACQGLGGDHAARSDDSMVGTRCGTDATGRRGCPPRRPVQRRIPLAQWRRAQPHRDLPGSDSERKLVFTWDLPGERESLVTFLLEPIHGGTELTLRHEHLPDEAQRDSHERGWNGLLDKLPIFLGVC